jgi:hypothetical protein
LDFGRLRLSGPSSLLPCTWQTPTRIWPELWRFFCSRFFACLTLRRTGALWFAIGFHAAGDYAETFLFSVRDSGYAASWTFLNSSFHGPGWLTGGKVGPEASVFSMLVLCVAMFCFHFFVSPSWSPGIGTTGIACASETISRIALREPAWVLKKYVAFREWRFAARPAFLLLIYYHAFAPF